MPELTNPVDPKTAEALLACIRQLIEAAHGQMAQAWDEGVATALNHAIRNDDGITLRLEHLDGRQWANPYRKEGK